MKAPDLTTSIRHTNGLLLYMLYRELQEVMAHDVIIPRLDLWPLERLLAIVEDSKATLTRQYEEFSAAIQRDDELRDSFYGYLKSLFQKDGPAAPCQQPADLEHFLRSRLAELILSLDGIAHYRSAPSAVRADPGCRAAIVSRTIWPVLFFRPAGSDSCWTWPPDEQFVLKRIATMLKAGRPNIYLPTVLPMAIDVGMSLSAAAKTALRAAHRAAGSGNDQDIANEPVERLAAGVGAFDDRIVGNYHDVQRSQSAIYYDLMLGVLSGLQFVVSCDHGTGESVGLLVFCSPLVRFFHELAGIQEQEGRDGLLLAKAPGGLETELAHEFFRQPWQRFGREVFATGRVLAIDGNDRQAGNLITNCRDCFANSNGPVILGHIGHGYQIATARLERSRQTSHVLPGTLLPSNLSAVDLCTFVPGRSSAATKLRDEIRSCAGGAAPVILSGERGVGKYFVATAIQELRGHRQHRFACNQLKDADSEKARDEFCGCAGKRYYSTEEYEGLFLVLRNETVYLDEIHLLSESAVSVLLSILDRKEVARRGKAELVHKVDFRLITATNRNLIELAAQSELWDDLYSRIEGVTIRVPPLRERLDDIPDYADLFSSILGIQIAEDAKRALTDTTYNWPYNVRELEKVVQKGAARAKNAGLDIINKDAMEVEFAAHRQTQRCGPQFEPPVKQPSEVDVFHDRRPSGKPPTVEASSWKVKLGLQKNVWAKLGRAVEQYRDTWATALELCVKENTHTRDEVFFTPDEAVECLKHEYDYPIARTTFDKKASAGTVRHFDRRGGKGSPKCYFFKDLEDFAKRNEDKS